MNTVLGTLTPPAHEEGINTYTKNTYTKNERTDAGRTQSRRQRALLRGGAGPEPWDPPSRALPPLTSPLPRAAPRPRGVGSSWGPAEFQKGADSHANFLCSFCGRESWKPGQERRSFPTAHFLRLSHPERAGAADSAVPLVIPPGAPAGRRPETAQSALSHLLCRVGFK